MLKETKIIGFNCTATCFWISFWNEVHTRHHCSLWMNQLNCKTLTLAYGIFNWSLKRSHRRSVSVKQNFQSEFVKGMIVTDECLVGAKPVERANQKFLLFWIQCGASHFPSFIFQIGRVRRLSLWMVSPLRATLHVISSRFCWKHSSHFYV